MSASEAQIDDIVAEINDEQTRKLGEFWLKLDYLTRLDNFSKEVMRSPEHSKTSPLDPKRNDIAPQYDMDVAKTKAFQKAVNELTPKALHDSLWTMVKNDDPDTLLVRFLRARSWDVDKALVMMLNSVSWRLEEKVESEIIGGGDWHFAQLEKEGTGEKQKIGSEVMQQLRSAKSFTRGTDKDGRPLLFTRVRHHISSAQSRESLEQYIIFNSETARMLLRAPQTTVAMVFDLTGFGMANMDWNALRLMASGLADNYPESLGALYVYRPPWIVNGIWSAVKGWLDPVIASKVKFVNSVEELAEHVPMENIPKDMGGPDDWEYRYIEPTPPAEVDEAKKDALRKERTALLTEYENATRDWAEQIRLPNAAELMKRRRELLTQVRNNYWQIDPYVRGRTLLDRVGVIGSDGSYNPLAPTRQ